MTLWLERLPDIFTHHSTWLQAFLGQLYSTWPRVCKDYSPKNNCIQLVLFLYTYSPVKFYLFCAVMVVCYSNIFSREWGVFVSSFVIFVVYAVRDIERSRLIHDNSKIYSPMSPSRQRDSKTWNPEKKSSYTISVINNLMWNTS